MHSWKTLIPSTVWLELTGAKIPGEFELQGKLHGVQTVIVMADSGITAEELIVWRLMHSAPTKCSKCSKDPCGRSRRFYQKYLPDRFKCWLNHTRYDHLSSSYWHRCSTGNNLQVTSQHACSPVTGQVEYTHIHMRVYIYIWKYSPLSTLHALHYPATAAC